jgi:DNA-binding winged helix-turn-helix (wHTH) protein
MWRCDWQIAEAHSVVRSSSRGWFVELARSSSGGRWASAVGDAAEASPRKSQGRCVLFGDFELDLQEQALRRSGEAVKIPGKIYQAMVVLIESQGDLVTRDQIRSRLWPRGVELNYDANVNTTVNKLRQVLGDTSAGANFIQTIPRRGYSFVAPVRYADAPAPAARACAGRKIEPMGARVFVEIAEVLRSERARIWFTASVVTWVVAAILFAGMLLWQAHRGQGSAKSPAQIIDGE